MIRMTKETDYGIVILSQFARRSTDEIATAKDIAEDTKISLPMVYKILKLLVSRGFLQSHRGTRGGYSLSRSPQQISLQEIIVALEGPVCITECCGEPGSCRLEETCTLGGHWKNINNAFRVALEGVKLSSMTKPAGKLETMKRIEIRTMN